MRILTVLFILFISFPAHAESRFITWPIAIDAKFRAAYYAKTGEYIQSNPAISEDELTYMVASSRVTDQWLNELKANTSLTTKDEIKSRKGLAPESFTEKAIEE